MQEDKNSNILVCLS